MKKSTFGKNGWGLQPYGKMKTGQWPKLLNSCTFIFSGFLDSVSSNFSPRNNCYETDENKAFLRNIFGGLSFRGLSFRRLSFRGPSFQGLSFRGLSFRLLEILHFLNFSAL